MQLNKKQTLKCLYCGDSQDCRAIDAVPCVPNLWGFAKKTYQTCVQEQQGGSCDENFYLRLHNDKIFTANLPSKLYNI